ncbi:P1 family peptidase [Sphingosinicella soli]|uniref:P1 family peptidase n=1 Tax=Sphingosinicella soli TaxID=333708 RepID=UPI00311C9980
METKMGQARTRGMVAAAAAAIALALTGAPLAAQSPAQDALKLTINDGYGSPAALRFDWPALRIGTGQYEDGPTGLTVFRFDRRVFAAVDVRGGGPGTVNTEYLKIGYPFPELDAVVFSGGSWYGLEAVTAVNTALKDEGYRGGNWDNIGLTVGSIIYDFGGRRLNEIYPDKRLAQAALKAATPGVFPRGAYGAGRSAISGSIFGCNAHSGQGGAFRQTGELKIAAFTVVNALGIVTDRDGRAVACYPDTTWLEGLKTQHILAGAPASGKPGWQGQPMDASSSMAEGPASGEKKNTTISLIVVNQKMEPSELQRLAIQVHTSMARGIQPFQTEFDGDVLYAVSTAEYTPPEDKRIASIDIGTMASEVMWDAILSAVPPQPAAASETPDRHPADKATLRRLTGRYTFSALAELELTVDQDKLFGKATGARKVFGIPKEAPVELLRTEAGDFVVPGRYPTVLRFDDRGGVIVNPGRWQQTGRKRGN